MADPWAKFADAPEDTPPPARGDGSNVQIDVRFPLAEGYAAPSPDSTTLDMSDLPDSAPADDFAQFADAPMDSDGGATSDAEPSALPPGQALGAGVRDIMNGVAGIGDFVSLPITTLARLFGVDPGSLRGLSNQAADAMGLGVGNPVISAINEGAVAGMTGAGVGPALARMPGVAGAIGETLAASPVADVVSNAAGAGSAEAAHQSGAGPLAQFAAGIAGGGLGAAGVIGGASAARRVTKSTEPSELLAAFQRQQVTPMADQVGGAGTRTASAVSRATLGGIPLAKAAEKSIETARAARDRIAASMGRVSDDTGAGQAAQKGANTFVARTADKARALYEAIPVSPTRQAVTTNTRRALEESTQGFLSNPELSRIWAGNPRLEATLRALEGERTPMGGRFNSGEKKVGTDIKGGGVSWQDMKRLRSIVGEIAGKPSLSDDGAQIASMKKLYGALSEDMRATAAADGPKSLRAFERANTYYRARQARIDDTLTHILGDDYKKSPEAAFSQIDRWARDGGDSARLARTIRSLPEDEAAEVRATVFARMGARAPGMREGQTNSFSPAEFARQWEKMDDRAKSVMFPGAQYRQSLTDIADIARAMKRSGEFANTSRTALASNGIGLVSIALMSVARGSVAGVATAGGIAGSQLAAGSLLASPRFARWLASAPKKPIGPATLAHINRLTSIAATEPTIANEVLALQQRLASAFTDNPVALHAAASPENAPSEEENQDGR